MRPSFIHAAYIVAGLLRRVCHGAGNLPTATLQFDHNKIVVISRPCRYTFRQVKRRERRTARLYTSPIRYILAVKLPARNVHIKQ